MIFTLKTHRGLVYSYLDWTVVDVTGTPKDGGEYIYISDLWVHEDYCGKDAILKFVEMISEDSRINNCQYVYWQRSKYNYKLSKLFSVEAGLRRINHGFKTASRSGSPATVSR